MFISNVSKETNDKEMKTFIELLQVTVLELVRVSHDDSVYKSFKLTVYPEDFFFNMTHICGHLVYVSENIVHQTRYLNQKQINRNTFICLFVIFYLLLKYHLFIYLCI